MGKSLTQKILEQHIVEGEWNPGSEIGIRIDQTLTQDATGTMAYLQFEAMGLDRIKTELSVSYIDHNTVQIGFENADDHKYLTSIARKYGIYLSRAGNGICHQVHLERFGRPGRTLLGSDSHTPTGGGVGMIAIGAGGLDIAMALGGAPFYTTCPKVIKVNLKGKLQPWVAAKDVILKMLEIFTTKGNVGCVFEYAGEGVSTLTVPERATITNMGAECGVTTSVFPSDGATKAFLEAQGRGDQWEELKADDDAEYFKEIDLDLSELVPLAATPHSPGNISTIEKLAGMKVDQVCIGSCTNSSYTDLVTVAKVLKGKTVHPDVSFVVAPGSKQVVQNMIHDGYWGDIIASGARIAENACGFCIGNSMSPPSKAVTLRTSNRNFLGRSGTKDADAYLVSPETAAAAVIKGVVTDPRTLGMDYPEVAMPGKFLIDDGLVIRPEDTPSPASVEILRGPNIGEPPTNVPLAETISGPITIKVEDKITTDHIIPAGARMKYRSNVPKYSEFVFEVLDTEFPARAAKNRDAGKHNIIVGGESYGQGSSREHAAICPSYLGVRAVIAKSFERIHTANLINFGILPLTFRNEADYEAVAQGDELELPDVRKALESGAPIRVVDKTNGKEFEVEYNLSQRQKAMLMVGGALAYAKGA